MSDPDNKNALQGSWVNVDRLFPSSNPPIDRLVQIVSIPGATDLPAELTVSNRKSSVFALTDRLVSGAIDSTRSSWEEEYKKPLAELKKSVKSAVETSVTENQKLVNEALEKYLPIYSIALKTGEPSVTVNCISGVSPVLENSQQVEFDLTNEGHGNQRAVLMAMTEAVASQADAPDGEAPLIILTAEEPEAYQHLTRVRHFAKSLKRFSSKDNLQVLVATHHPQFVRPEVIEGIRRILPATGDIGTTSRRVLLRELEERLNLVEIELHKVLEKNIRGEFSDTLFAPGVIILEGDTDRAIWEEPLFAHETP